MIVFEVDGEVMMKDLSLRMMIKEFLTEEIGIFML